MPIKYLQIRGSIKLQGGVDYEAPIAIVTGITKDVVFHDHLPILQRRSKKEYVKLQYYSSLQSFKSGDIPLTLADGTSERIVLYTGCNLLEAYVNEQIAGQVNAEPVVLYKEGQ